jgi:NosR/NirI family transcriptional regulator, nitrous oxide reductase regulator
MSCGMPLDVKSGRRLRRCALGIYRLGLLAAALFAISVARPGGQGTDQAVLLEGARGEISGVVALGDPQDGFFPLLDGGGETRGWVTSSFPQAARIQGYSGPSELLIVLDASRKLRAVRLIQSADTAGHVAKVKADEGFWDQWSGRDEARLGAYGTPRIVSGATLTSEAMARGVAARFGAAGLDEWFTKALDPAAVARWFPQADRVEAGREPGVSRVFAGERELGRILRSSRMGVTARGFNGSSDVIVALDGGKVLGVGLLDSRDNEPYVGDVKEELRFADGFAGRDVREILDGNPADGLTVSGASVTAGAVISSVREMLRRHTAEPSSTGIPWGSLAAFAWIGAGLFAGLSKRGSAARWRTVFACVSVAAGLTLGWMLGQDQILGWARHGVDASKSLPLVLLTAVALLVPVLSGKNVYCSRICPHGAAQSLLGKLNRRRFALPASWHRLLQRVPWLTLFAIWLLALLGSGLPFAHAEPFEIWSAGFYAILPAAVFSVGLIAAFFLPQAYCNYGCPTGALLKFLTHSPGSFTRRDGIAGLLVAGAWVYLSIA